MNYQPILISLFLSLYLAMGALYAFDVKYMTRSWHNHSTRMLVLLGTYYVSYPITLRILLP